MIDSLKEPEPEAESVLSLDFIECMSVDISRQLFNSTWHELKTVLRNSEVIAIANTIVNSFFAAEHILDQLAKRTFRSRYAHTPFGSE